MNTCPRGSNGRFEMWDVFVDPPSAAQSNESEKALKRDLSSKPRSSELLLQI